MDPDFTCFKSHIYSGMSCEKVGASYWDGSDECETMLATTDLANGFTRNSLKVENGFRFNGNNGQAIVSQKESNTCDHFKTLKIYVTVAII